jgi:prophage regulatory protein
MAVEKQQFQLPLQPTTRQPPRPELRKVEDDECPRPERVTGIDQVLSTHDVERITGRHRCTIYRWVRAGIFPLKRAGGGKGWLRSDVERWLRGNASSM